jgi:hypothetical protein
VRHALEVPAAAARVLSNLLLSEDGSHPLRRIRRLLLYELTVLFARRVSPLAEAVDEDAGGARHPQKACSPKALSDRRM